MRFVLPMLGVVALTIGAVSVSADDAAKKKEAGFKATCPVSGKPATKDNSVKFRGKSVYFCCGNCPNAFKADRKKFDLQVKTQLLETKQITQVGCPLSGKGLDESATVALGTTKVQFCCQNCVAKAKDSGNLAKLVFTNFDKGFTLQTKCPISGKPIAAAHAVEHEGKKAFFCCPNCPKAFQADPAKYLAKLPQFKAPKKGKKKQ